MTTTPSVEDDRLTQMAVLLWAVLGDPIELAGKPDLYLHLGFGSDPTLKDGKVSYGSWQERAYRWPSEASRALGTALTRSETEDCFFTPCLSKTEARSRSKGHQPQERIGWLWWDLDGASPEQVRLAHSLVAQGGIIVNSGRGAGHVHVYVKLSYPLAPDMILELLKRGAQYLGADPAPGHLAALMRLPGSFNRKPQVLDGSPPALVSITAFHQGPGAFGLFEIFPKSLIPRRTRSLTVAATGGTGGEIAGKPPAKGWSRQMKRLIDRRVQEGQRHQHHYLLVATANEEGLSLENAIAAAAENQSVVEKFGSRLAEETARVWEKLEPAQPTKVKYGNRKRPATGRRR